jgi:hypothetical protein
VALLLEPAGASQTVVRLVPQAVTAIDSAATIESFAGAWSDLDGMSLHKARLLAEKCAKLPRGYFLENHNPGYREKFRANSDDQTLGHRI